MFFKKTIYQPSDTIRVEELAGTQLASFFQRALALFIDFWAAGISFVLVTLIVFFIESWTGLFNLDPDLHVDFTFFENWYSLIWLVLYFMLSVYFSNGKTIGKLICRIRIESLVHKRLNLWHSFERAIGYGASALEFGFGFLQYFIRSDRRTIHDRIAETIVVTEPAKKKKPKKSKKDKIKTKKIERSSTAT